MTGLELLQTLRVDPSLQHIPFLLVTAEARKENIIEAAQAGADGYILKPFSQETLRERVVRIIEKRLVSSNSEFA